MTRVLLNLKIQIQDHKIVFLTWHKIVLEKRFFNFKTHNILQLLTNDLTIKQSQFNCETPFQVKAHKTPCFAFCLNVIEKYQ